MTTCQHLAETVPNVTPVTPQGCQECLANGTPWLHLRLCLICGHVGCCNDSPQQHAKQHAHDSGHHIIQSFQPQENWLYCYADDLMMPPSPGHGYEQPPALLFASAWRPLEEEEHHL